MKQVTRYRHSPAGDDDLMILMMGQVLGLLLLPLLARADGPLGHAHDHAHPAPAFSDGAFGSPFSRGGRQQDFFNTNLRSFRFE